MKIFPQGLGVWIWQIPQCDGGDWNKIIARCQNAGIRWVAIKSGDAYRNKQFNSANAKNIIEKCHKHDILVYSWNYSKPVSWREEIVQIKSLFDDGVDGHIIDAEAEWQMDSNSKSLAIQFLTELRKLVPNGFIAHAPFPIVEFHLPFPYIEFGTYCDAIMPQSYWTEIDWTYKKTMDKTDLSWKTFNEKHASAAKPVYPVGVTYGKGYPKVPGELKAEDISDFINRYSNIPISLYSYDAAKSFPIVWETLNNIESAKKKIPLPPMMPIIIDFPKADPVIDTSVDNPLPVPNSFWGGIWSKIFSKSK